MGLRQEQGHVLGSRYQKHVQPRLGSSTLIQWVHIHKGSTDIF